MHVFNVLNLVLVVFKWIRVHIASCLVWIARMVSIHSRGYAALRVSRGVSLVVRSSNCRTHWYVCLVNGMIPIVMNAMIAMVMVIV